MSPRRRERPIEIEDVKRLRLDPGDALVLKLRRPLPPERLRVLIDTLRRAFPGHRVAIIDFDAELTVVEPPPDRSAGE